MFQNVSQNTFNQISSTDHYVEYMQSLHITSNSDKMRL